MTFQHPNAVPFLNNSGLDVNVGEHSADIIGHRDIGTAVETTIPAYDRTLHFGLETPAKERHERLGGLAFGKIEHDIARLMGLADAMENISTVIRDGKSKLAHDWKGESYDAFRANIENVEKTLDDYKSAVRTTAKGLATALSGIRQGYQAYRTDCLENHFNWAAEGLAAPGDWWRMSADSPKYLAEHCASNHLLADCYYTDAGLAGLLYGRLTTNPIFNDTLEKWDCTQNTNVVRGQYMWAVTEAENQRKRIHRKIKAYCEEADSLRDTVTKAYDAALENLRILAESSVFSNLSVPGAGKDPASGGDPGPGDSPGGDSPGGSPGGGGPGADAAMPQPAQVDPTAVPGPAADPAQPDPAQPAAREGVTVKDGDRSISVTSPDGAGHVKVTVEGADGKAKSYDLDFDAASGLAPSPGAEDGPANPDAERVPAGTNGQCVIKDGPLTITAERPLFAPDTIKLEVDDGVNDPSVYTVDFDQPTGAADGQSAADPALNGKADPSVSAEPSQPGSESFADNGKPTEPEQLTTAQAVLPGDPGSSAGSALGAMAGASGDSLGVPAGAPGEAALGAPGEAALGDAGSGPVVPDQSTGEAGLSSAGDGEPGGAAGDSAAGAMPMMAGAGAGAGSDGGRAGTGWSVHGDLFDNHDPVYSMHGVLGEDDLEGR